MSLSPTSTSEQLTDVSDEDYEIIHTSSESCSVSAETFLSLPEDVLALSKEELESTVENFKSLILSKPEDLEEKKWLVRRLIELRLRLESIKGTFEDTTNQSSTQEDRKVVLGHHFKLENCFVLTVPSYCDRCSGILADIYQNYYMCSDCKYKCHIKCLSSVCRICADVVVCENSEYILEICPEPEEGLASQNYRCMECLTHFGLRKELLDSYYSIKNFTKGTTGNNVFNPRLCDYTGKYYCTTCHWNSTSAIPARVVLNWDFTERTICRSSKQILNLMSKLPILKLEELNPVLFACIEELGTVKEMRQQLMEIKKYLISCKSADKKRLLWQSSDRVHFFENTDKYSMQDLLELKSGVLIRNLKKIKSDFLRHIQVECEVCKGRGFFCELCKGQSIIFPFEENVISCPKCHAAFHFFCWVENNEQCPKCTRIQQRLLKSQADAISNAADS